MSAPSIGRRLPLRSRLGIAATNSVNALSRRLGRGSGTVVGGRAGLLIDPALVERLAEGRTVALVSGTNGKTTTTALLAAALEAGGAVTVVTNATGSNMPAGHAAALSNGPFSGPVVLEVDEGYLPQVREATHPGAVVLLNLSRDQLDRVSEVRMTAGRWRRAFAGEHPGVVVANADDPLVVWGAGAAPSTVWVAAGLRWRGDAIGCPACDGTITFASDPPEVLAGPPDGRRIGPGAGWACAACDFARPAPDIWLEETTEGGTEAVSADGRRAAIELSLPGHFNRANALMAAAAAEALGVPITDALGAMSAVGEVAGRFTVHDFGRARARLLLAKNPAGWAELLELVRDSTTPVVIGINARVADGRDPSWLWDVPFEVLAGRPVVATGERCLDLSVRLHYAEVAHETIADQVQALAVAARSAETEPPGRANDGARAPVVDYVGNYTAFHDLLGRG